MSNTSPLTYRSAGVDIDKADELIDHIKQQAKRTTRPGVLAGIGGFGAAFEIPKHFREPVLISGTDGVGTKLKLAIELQQHHTIGIDLVAMCVNDIITLGAEPLFFLDYYATGQLNLDQSKAILSGIVDGCEQAGAALIGGETAEMPGMYHGNDYDLAGFCVGVVEKSDIINAKRIHVGDALIAVASSGPHSNGYSLIRKVIQHSEARLNQTFEKTTLGETLLTPTKIYVKSLLSLFKKITVHGVAHITGGGLLENIPRILPEHTQAHLLQNTWEWPTIFHWLQEHGKITDHEMMRTFNVGVGMIIAVAKEDVTSTLDSLHQSGEIAWEVGKIITSNAATPNVFIE